MSLRHPATALLLLVSLLSAACGGTPPSRLYTLSSIADRGNGEASAPNGQRRIIAVGPVSLARYLQYAGIITREGENGLSRSELERWGAPLTDEVSRVLVENLGRLLPAGDFLVLPWLESSATAYRTQITVTRFDGPLQGPVRMNATWLLLERESGRLLASGELALSEPLQGEGYPPLTGAMSRCLAELSRRIAAEIRSVDAMAKPSGQK